MVYFIQGKETKRIKIGFSASKFVVDRLRTHQIGSPDILEVLAIWMSGSKWDERSLHSEFRDCHSHGEWFNPGEKLMEYIKLLKERMPQEILLRKIFGGKKQQALLTEPKPITPFRGNTRVIATPGNGFTNKPFERIPMDVDAEIKKWENKGKVIWDPKKKKFIYW